MKINAKKQAVTCIPINKRITSAFAGFSVSIIQKPELPDHDKQQNDYQDNKKNFQTMSAKHDLINRTWTI